MCSLGSAKKQDYSRIVLNQYRIVQSLLFWFLVWSETAHSCMATGMQAPSLQAPSLVRALLFCQLLSHKHPGWSCSLMDAWFVFD